MGCCSQAARRAEPAGKQLGVRPGRRSRLTGRRHHVSKRTKDRGQQVLTVRGGSDGAGVYVQINSSADVKACALDTHTMRARALPGCPLRRVRQTRARSLGGCRLLEKRLPRGARGRNEQAGREGSPEEGARQAHLPWGWVMTMSGPHPLSTETMSQTDGTESLTKSRPHTVSKHRSPSLRSTTHGAEGLAGAPAGASPSAKAASEVAPASIGQGPRQGAGGTARLVTPPKRH